MRTVTRLLVLTALLAGCGGEEPGDFSPLIQAGSYGQYDIVVANVASVRGAELAPGAEPGRPVIDGDTARRRVHFVVTYSEAVDPSEIGHLMVDGLGKVRWFVNGEVETQSGNPFTADVSYDTRSGGCGTLHLELRATGNPNQLDLRYEVEEER